MAMTRPIVCLDVGSGWVKALGIDGDGEPSGCAQHATTPHDLLLGVRAAAASVGLHQPLSPRRGESEVELLACSSVGGGLRLAVVGQERLAATEAGYRVSRSAGARVVHVEAGPLEPAGVRALRSARPDVVLLLGPAGGPAGGPGEGLLLGNAARLARARVRAPIVLSVPDSARAPALELLASTGRTVLAADPVLRDGEIVPEPARAAVAELLSGHLVGGRGSATTASFRRLARQPTPGAVRRGVLELAAARGPAGGAVLVVDVGCSTTDVYSVLPGRTGPEDTRCTAEADLGMRPTSAGILVEGQAEGLVDPVEADLLAPTVHRLSEEPGFLPTDAGGRAEDRRLAALAAVLAARRHLRVVDGLAEAGIGLLVLTGGVFRQPERDGMGALRSTLRSDVMLSTLLRGCPIAVDDGFALAPAGLLALAGRTDAARLVLDAAIAADPG
jgi:uncharacterized protein (TIGR01319 family)